MRKEWDSIEFRSFNFRFEKAQNYVTLKNKNSV